jgi:coenzyme PQQ biosynthesis probable peptidase PqqF
MPAQNSPDTERLTLSNGLSVVLCHAPRLKRCAASLRVAAGNHDVPGKWPGLAHFLEHLFFLGTERFGAEQKLMSFVQRHGGQINASTKDRTTDFFFELPTAAFADGVERLCDMLAHPRMDPAEQLREREVLHAEFIAWSRDAEARYQTTLLAPVNPQHPLRGFHAGNRYSLAVPNPDFQQALKDFYTRFYQAGQLTLCLTGPLPLAELRALAETHGATFITGEAVDRQAPAPLRPANPVHWQDGSSNTIPNAGFCSSQLAGEDRRLHLLFACESLPAAADEAVTFLCHWLNTPKAGGLINELVNKGLIGSLKAAPLYYFDGQLLLDVEFHGADPASRSTIAALFFSWLRFFTAQWPRLVDEFNAVQQRRLETCGPLELAHHYCRDLPGAFGEDGRQALTALLAQLTPQSLLPAQRVPLGICEPTFWQLPKPNPFLQKGATTSIPATEQKSSPVIYLPALPGQSGEAAIFLHWQLRCARPRLWRLLNDGLQAIIEDARQAGVNLAFSAYGSCWQLKLTGIRQPMAVIIEQVLQRLEAADEKSLDESENAHQEPPLIPIRQLLKVLPDRYLPTEAGLHDALSSAWSGAEWRALVVGLAQADEAQVNAVLSSTPGKPQSQLPPPQRLVPGKRWVHEFTESSEDAVLVFCPTASLSIKDEAAWRMLAHLLQGPFYQRLRVELQLGYAVFSGLRQIAGRSGLLFGVQSPACTAEELVRHIEAFLKGLPDLIASVDLGEQKQALIAQFDPQSLPNEQLAELSWQAHLAGHDGNYLKYMQGELATLDEPALLEAARALTSADAGWLILANRPATPPRRIVT